MGDVIFRLDADTAKAVQGILALANTTRTAEHAVGNLGKRGKESAGMMGQAFDGAAASMLGMVAGLASIGKGISIFKEYKQHLKEIKDLQVQIGESSLQLQKSILPLSEQQGRSTPEGNMRSLRDAAKIAQEGAIPIEMGTTVLQAALGKIPDGPGVSQAGRRGVAVAAAKALGKGGVVDNQEAEGLVQILANLGAKDEAGAMKILSKFQAGLLTSDETSIGKYATTLVKGAIGPIATGATIDQVVRMAGQARKVTATEDEAAEMMRMLFQHALADPDAKKLIGKSARKSAAEVESMSGIDRVMAMQQAVQNARTQAGPAGVQKLFSGLDQRAQSLFLRYYSEEAIAAGEWGYQRSQKADAGALSKEYASAGQTDVARAQRFENDRRLQEAEEAHKNFLVTELRKKAAARLNQERRKGGIKFSTEKLSTDEGLLETAERVVQLEALGLGAGDLFNHFYGEDKNALSRARSAIGIPEDQVILDMEQLTPKQLDKLASEHETRSARANKDPRQSGWAARARQLAAEKRAAARQASPVNQALQEVPAAIGGAAQAAVQYIGAKITYVQNYLQQPPAIRREHPNFPKVED